MDGYSRASAAQEAMWLSPDATDGSATFSLLWYLRFEGPLDLALLRRAVDQVVARHDALRAVFRWAAERLETATLPPSPVVLDLCDAPVDPNAFGGAPYDLWAGPLFRFQIVRSGPEDHMLLCGFHHLVMDGTSWPILANEIVDAALGMPLPPAPPGPSAHVQAQTGWLAGPEAETARQAWRQKLSGVDEAWTLPSEVTASRRFRSTQAQTGIADLTEALSAELRRVALELGTTPFRLALAAFVALMARHGRREDVLISTTMTGRPGAEFRRSIGYLVNTALLSAPVEAPTSLGDLARHIHGEIDLAVTHEYLPYRHGLQAAGLPQEAVRDGVTGISFTRRPKILQRQDGSLRTTDGTIHLPFQDRDLAVQIQKVGATFHLIWRWREQALRAETASSLSMQYHSLLAQALAQPDLPLSSFSTLPDSQRRQILGPFNTTDVPFPEMAPLHVLVSRQAALTPDRIAVVQAEAVYTYAEIDAASNRLAAALVARGVAAGQFVPLRLQPSAEMLVAELAVMKCGSAFVPLSPDWPETRVEALRARLGPAPLIEAGPPLEGSVSATDALMGRDDPGAPDRMVALDDPIYCIFTSGSTGQPKGAVNAHRGIVNRLLAMSHAFGSPAEDTVLSTAAPTVDSLVWQYFWPLISGGTTVIPAREQAVSPSDLCRLMEDHAVTVTDFVPAIFADLVAHVAQRGVSALDCLRLVVIGGEAMRPADAQVFRNALPHVALVNSYGPTETSIATIFHILPVEAENPIPLGRPYANVRAIVLSGSDPAPLGTVGDLYLGGVCVGLGYLNDPAATAGAFIPNPFPELRSDRLYRTGDLARMRHDGVIEFIGRADHQIKIRGLRIEPGEVEAALLRQRGIAAAVVSKDDADDPHLVAHIVLEPDTAVDARSLRHGLMRLLPVHMVPARFVVVEAFPTLSAGKVDRKAATRLTGRSLTVEYSQEPPQTETERLLAPIWCAELGVARIGRDEDIFRDLAADSLAAMRLALATEAVTGSRIDLATLFQAPTLRQFAGRLDRTVAASPDQLRLMDRLRAVLLTWEGDQLRPDGLLFAKNTGGRRHPLFWCLQGYDELQALSRHVGPDRPVVGMRSGHLVMDYSDANVALVSERYVDEILEFQPEGPLMIGGNCQAATIAIAMTDRLRQKGRNVALVFLMEEPKFPPLPGKVALLFGRDSHLNPFALTEPSERIAAAYPDGASVDFVPGGHGQLFTAGLGHILRTRLAGVDPAVSAHLSIAGKI